MGPKITEKSGVAVRDEAVAQESASLHPKPPLKPEEQELALKREEQTALEAELAERELRATHLRAELGAFERQFLHTVGLRYAELDEFKAQLAERLAAEQPDNQRVQKNAREARGRADETKLGAGEKSDQEPRSFKASPGMKKTYREVAKRIHPDLTSDRDDRTTRQRLMAQANEAYERGDESALSKILSEYESSPEAFPGEGAAAELVRVIRRLSQIRGRLAELEAESQAMLRSDLYQLRLRVDEASQHGYDVLKEMVGKIEDQIAEAKRRLANKSANGSANNNAEPKGE